MVSPRRPGANARTKRRHGRAGWPNQGQLGNPGQREVRAFFSQADESATGRRADSRQRVTSKLGSTDLGRLTHLLKSTNFSGFAIRRWPAVLFGVGLLLLLYVGAQYLSMWHEQRAFAEEWSRNSNTGAAASPVEVNGQSGIARLIIPRLDLQEVVVEGTSYQALKAGPGHVLQTPLPGDPGNAVLAGHRDTFFRRLNDLAPGDPMLIERAGRTYRFTVGGRKIVDPGDVSVLKPSTEPMLTLITCYPPHFIGPAPKRLVIIGTMDHPSESPAQRP